jgi:hypothetical protein
MILTVLAFNIIDHRLINFDTHKLKQSDKRILSVFTEQGDHMLGTAALDVAADCWRIA